MTFSVEVANAEEITSGGHRIEIHVDKENLTSLIKRLQMLANESKGEHLHLMSDSWGLGDLTEESHGEGNVITHHLKVILD